MVVQNSLGKSMNPYEAPAIARKASALIALNCITQRAKKFSQPQVALGQIQ
jgi:hypothetical protein